MMFTNKEIVSKKVCSHAGNERYTSSMMETGAAELLWLLSKVLQRSFKCNKTVGRRKKQPKKHDIHFLSQEEDHHQEEWRVKKHLLLWSRTFSGESAILSAFMVIHKFLIFSCIRTTIYKSLVQKYKKIISLQKYLSGNPLDSLTTSSSRIMTSTTIYLLSWCMRLQRV